MHAHEFSASPAATYLQQRFVILKLTKWTIFCLEDNKHWASGSSLLLLFCYTADVTLLINCANLTENATVMQMNATTLAKINSCLS